MNNLFNTLRARLFRPRPPAFTVACAASGESWTFTAGCRDELAALILQSIYGVSYPTARALAHAGFARGRGEYGETLSIRRGEG